MAACWGYQGAGRSAVMKAAQMVAWLDLNEAVPMVVPMAASMAGQWDLWAGYLVALMAGCWAAWKAAAKANLTVACSADLKGN